MDSLEKKPKWNATTGGAGQNREDDFSGNPYLGQRIDGKLHSNPVYLRTSLNPNVNKQIFGLGIRLSFGPVPLIRRDFQYTGDLPIAEQPDVERKLPWYRRVFS